MSTPEEIRAKLRELGYLKSPLNRFVFGAGGSGGALRLALGAGGRGALIAGPLIGLFTIVLFGHELAADERLSWFLACSLLAGVIVLAWVVAQALALHALARLRGRMVESLPAVAVILSGITFLLPALLWLLASRRIQSEALREGRLGLLALAVGLLFAASILVYLVTRAADALILGRIEIAYQRGRGRRIVLLGALLAAVLAGVFTAVRAPSSVQNSNLTAVARTNPALARRRLVVLAMDGYREHEVASSFGTELQFLARYPASEDLISGWMRFQTGRRSSSPRPFLGLRAAWGGAAHLPDSGPGRILKLLAPMKLSRPAPLPSLTSRPLYFWEPIGARTTIVGGWHLFPIHYTGAEVFTERLFPALMQEKLPLGLFTAGGVNPAHRVALPARAHDAAGLGVIAPEGIYPYPDDWSKHKAQSARLQSDFERLSPGPLGKRLDQFNSELGGWLDYHNISGTARPGKFDGSDGWFHWIYLPGADILCSSNSAQCEAYIRDVRNTIKRALMNTTLDDSVQPMAILLIENPGRRGGTGAIWFRPAKDETIRPIRAPEEVAAAVLDYLGYPLAADLAGVKPEEAQLPTYGTVTLEDPGDDSDDATLKALKQLGYIQ